ncbi:MAG: aldehyde dehydrogenase family protein [Actinobacteria bacterium]|nr:aldehyde dehydrogenase family protein [Actinomycetota bacterium]
MEHRTPRAWAIRPTTAAVVPGDPDASLSGPLAPYRGPAVADIPTHSRLLLDGRWEARGAHLPVVAPWSGEVLTEMALGTAGDVDRAVALARVAVGRLGTAGERARVLDRTADLLVRDREHLARIIASEAGKPWRAATLEVDRAVETLRFSAAEARTLGGASIPMDAHPAGDGVLGFTLREPIGVVAAITPFNFPLNLVAHKLGPALAAGCPVVLKPAEKTPLSALALVERMLEAGAPAQAVQVVTGTGPEVGAALAGHPDVDVVTFTGSATVGHALKAAAAPRAEVLLELGSPAPLVVEADADLDAVVPRIAAHGFGHAGQSCVSVQRVLVHDALADALVDRLAEQVGTLVVGDPLEPGTDVSCLIDETAAARVADWIAEAVAAGATVRVGGERDGATLSPTLVVDVPRDVRLWTEEVFGPVVAVTRFTTTDEAIAEIAGGPDLIQAGVFTASLDTALRYVRELRVGTVLVNESPTYRADHMPYGGVGLAGNTREGPAATVRELTREKLVLLRSGADR